jgi:PAS domain S-box-containing protein
MPADDLGELAIFRSYFKESSDAVWVGDFRGLVILQNPAAERLSGYTTTETLAKLNLAQLCAPGYEGLIRQQLRSETRGGRGRIEGLQIELLTKSGQRIPIALNATLLRLRPSSRRTTGVLVVVRDLRERLELEAQLADARRRLERGEQQVMLAELAGTAAHELNQPLTSVMGYAELLRRKLADDDPLAQPLDVILQESERMADLVRRIGRVSRYETKAYPGGARIVDLDRSAPDEK